MFSTHNKKRPAASLHEQKINKKRHSKQPFNLNEFLHEMFGDYLRSKDASHQRIIILIKLLAKRITSSHASEELNAHDISEILVRFIIPEISKLFNYESSFIDERTKSDQIKAAIKSYINTQPTFIIQHIDRLLLLLQTDENDSILAQIAEDKSGESYTNFLDSIDTTNELLKKYGAGGTFSYEYISDFLRISRALSRKEMIYPYLDALENSLQYRASHEVENINLHAREDGKFTLALSSENIFRRHKLLSRTLYAWAKEHGFQSNVKILRNLSAERFGLLLQQMSFLKDSAIAVGTETHGAWSHALQWYIVFEHHKKTNFLQHDPAELYTRAQPAWDRLFDIVEPVDFTSPDHLTTLLCSREAEARWPLLAGSIIRTQAKMHSPYFDYDEYLKDVHKDDYSDGYIRRYFN